VFAVLTGPLRLGRVFYIGHGRVSEPNHAHVAQVLTADDNEVAASQIYSTIRSELPASQQSVQADSSGG